MLPCCAGYFQFSAADVHVALLVPPRYPSVAALTRTSPTRSSSRVGMSVVKLSKSWPVARYTQKTTRHCRTTPKPKEAEFFTDTTALDLSLFYAHSGGTLWWHTRMRHCSILWCILLLSHSQYIFVIQCCCCCCYYRWWVMLFWLWLQKSWAWILCWWKKKLFTCVLDDVCSILWRRSSLPLIKPALYWLSTRLWLENTHGANTLFDCTVTTHYTQPYFLNPTS